MHTLLWFGVPVLEVTGYWSDGLGLMVRFVLEGDDGNATWSFASMLEVAS